MRLNKDTRSRVKVGAILRDSIHDWKVADYWENERKSCAWVTLICIDQPWPKLYAEPLSNCYGMEIVEGE